MITDQEIRTGILKKKDGMGWVVDYDNTLFGVHPNDYPSCLEDGMEVKFFVLNGYARPAFYKGTLLEMNEKEYIEHQKTNLRALITREEFLIKQGQERIAGYANQLLELEKW